MFSTQLLIKLEHNSFHSLFRNKNLWGLLSNILNHLFHLKIEFISLCKIKFLYLFNF